jgi:fluoroacetyl-CoA thioesterase
MPDSVTIGMTAEKIVTVTSQVTVGHFFADLLQVHATPIMILHIMILHMEMTAGAAIASHLPEGFVSGMDVKVRHLAATPGGRTT